MHQLEVWAGPGGGVVVTITPFSLNSNSAEFLISAVLNYKCYGIKIEMAVTQYAEGDLNKT